MFATVHIVTVDFRLKCTLDLGGRAAEADRNAPAGDAKNLEALRLQPCRDLVDVALANAKAIGKLLGS